MEKPVSPQKNPYTIKVEKSKTYFWCSCGLSKKQPFCDGSHKKESKFEPIKYIAEETEELDFCGCKKSGRPPFCDGSHSWAEF
jgi:CDGSH-type Zn-finger protein